MNDFAKRLALMTNTAGASNENERWVLPLLVAVAIGLLGIIIWLWFRCGDEPTVDWLINGARELPVRGTS